MENISFIKDPKALNGTCYMEVIPGRYQKKHWQEGSLFFTESIFGLIEPIFQRKVSGYHHLKMNEVSKEVCLSIISEIEELNTFLNSSGEFSDSIGKIGYFDAYIRDQFIANYKESKLDLIRMNMQLIEWMTETLKSHKYISILGL